MSSSSIWNYIPTNDDSGVSRWSFNGIIHDFQTGFHPEFLKTAPKIGAAENQKLRFFPDACFQLCGVDALPAAKAHFPP